MLTGFFDRWNTAPAPGYYKRQIAKGMNTPLYTRMKTECVAKPVASVVLYGRLQLTAGGIGLFRLERRCRKAAHICVVLADADDLAFIESDKSHFPGRLAIDPILDLVAILS